MAIWRSGEVLILSFSGSGAKAAYFNVANSVTLAPALLMIQFSVMFVPSLTSRHVSSEGQKLISLMGYVRKDPRSKLRAFDQASPKSNRPLCSVR